MGDEIDYGVLDRDYSNRKIPVMRKVVYVGHNDVEERGREIVRVAEVEIKRGEL